MKWEDLRRSRNVQDRRGGRAARAGGAGIGLTLVALIAAAIFGVSPDQVLALLGAGTSTTVTTQTTPVNDEGADFVRAILGDTEDTWNSLLGEEYAEPTLVLFTDAVNSACGFANAAVGPFYCPADQQIYIDLGFFRQLRATAAEEGDFARAYVIAHEVAHHIQNQLGISTQVQRQKQQVDQVTSNRLSVMLELQADCLAGVWGHYAWQRDIIAPRDIQTALAAANEIGDDALQRRARGYVVPDSFTHGSSEQRMQWFTRGIESGDPGQCDTFSAGI